MKRCSLLLGAACVAALAVPATATVNLTGPNPSYSQNFNTLAATGTTVAWTNNSTIPGWYLYSHSGNPLASYNAGDGSTNNGVIYSFGTGTNSDRALGGVASSNAYWNGVGGGSGTIASGAVAGYIAAGFTNGSGLTIESFDIAYAGEQWRNGGNTSAQPMTLQYGFGATYAGVSTWTTPGGTFNYSSPVVGATAAAVDGNVAGKVAGRGGSVGSLTWAAGDTLWIRWIELNDSGNDHGLAVDDFALTTHTVPEPAGLALLALGAVIGIARRR